MLVYNFASFYFNAVGNMETIGTTKLEQEADQLNAYFDDNKDMLLATAVGIESALLNGADKDTIKGMMEYAGKQYEERHDKSLISIYGIINDVYVSSDGTKPEDDYNIRDSVWYTLAGKAEGQPAIVSPYYDVKSQAMVMTFCIRLKDGKSVIAIDINLDEAEIIKESTNTEGMGYGFVINKDGYVIAHHDEKENGKNYALDDENGRIFDKINGKTHGHFALTVGGERSTVFFDSVKSDLYVVMVVSNSSMSLNVSIVLLRNIIACVIVFMIILLFCTIFFTKLRKAIRREARSKAELQKLNVSTINALAQTIDAKDRYTNGHSQRVAYYSKEIARRMGKSESEQNTVYIAGLLHDLGKIRIPEAVINKDTSLSEDEEEIIKIHPITGYHILRGLYTDKSINEGAKYHHERYDGKGYPSRLSGDEIPEIARIIGVADSYDAMASNRSYRMALPQEVVRAEIEKGKNTQFDPDIADIMLQMIDEDVEYNMRQTEYQHKKILVVDDEDEVIKKVKHILRHKNLYNIAGARSGEDALNMLSYMDIDVILLDVNMPGIDGIETLRRIRKTSNIPVIFLATEKDKETLKAATDMGYEDYLSKPLIPTILKEMLHSILGY
jgi:putative nucleotidyltransferase with HDIG domain